MARPTFRFCLAGALKQAKGGAVLIDGVVAIQYFVLSNVRDVVRDAIVIRYCSLGHICGSVLLVGVMSTVLAGCGSSPTESQSQSVDIPGQEETPRLVITEHPFEDTVSLPSVDDLFRLTPEQIQRYEAFRAERIAAATADIEGANDGEDASRDSVLPEHELIGEYLEDMTDHFSYRGKTLVAQDALAEMTGNCMSLAVLTTALARYENVDVGYLLVTDSPVYQKQKGVVVRGQHVRSKLFDPTYEPGPGFLTIMRPSIVVDYFSGLFSLSGRRVSETEFIAMFYNNLSAESLIRGDLKYAYWSALEALEHDPANSRTVNVLALIYNRLGMLERADAMYRFGVQHAERKIELLNNYHNFLVKHDRAREAHRIAEQLKALDEHNPFDWLNIAYEALRNDELRRAALYFNKAMEIAPYLHQPYAGLAIVEYKRGHARQSRQLMEKALDSSYEKDVRQRYEDKLRAITIDES